MNQTMTCAITKAVIYVRVSSAAQVAKGQGAESQAARCAEFARMKGYEPIKIFEDKAVSGSLVDRPGMQALLGYVRKRRKENIRVLIDDISRLARGLDAHLALRAAIAEAGGVLESPSIEFGEDSDSQLIEHLLASVSAHARVKNAEQTRNRMEARIRSGYWPFSAVPGYRFERREGHGKLLVRDEPVASILQEALEGFASGHLQTQAEVIRFLEGQPAIMEGRSGGLSHQYVPKLLGQVLYAGMVERAEWGVSLRKAKHDGLISFETFERIQERLSGKAYAPARADISEGFPLRGAVECAECGSLMTSCWSKSKTGAKHPYYMCFKKGCGSYRKSIRRDAMEGAFEELLRDLTPAPSLLTVVRKMFANAWNLYGAQAREASQTLKRQLADLDKQIEALLDRIVDATSASVIGAYESRIEKLERDKLILAEKLAAAGQPRRPFDEVFELALDFLANPWKIWNNNDLGHKKAVLRLAFSAPLAYDRKTGFRTPQKSVVFKALDGVSGANFKMAERQGLVA